MTESIDIKGLDKAKVLKALYDAAKPLGLGALHFTGTDMPIEQAKAIVESGSLYFDYVYGRPLKVDLSGDSFSPWGYDRDQGEGRAARLIAALRAETENQEVES